MKASLLSLSLSLSLSLCALVGNAAELPEYDGQLLLVKTSNPDRLQAHHNSLNVEVRESYPNLGGWQVLAVPPGIDAEALAALYQEHEDVAGVSYNYYLEPTAVTPNDTSFSSQWSLHQGSAGHINAKNAWEWRTEALINNKPIVVAVMDSGVRATHEDLVGNMWINPGDSTVNSTDNDGNGFTDDVYGICTITDAGINASFAPDDYLSNSGHGTAAAGIIAATSNNSKGIAGVAWNAKIMVIRLFSAMQGPTVANALQGFSYAIHHGASVINLSFESDAVNNDPIRDAMKACGDFGIICVISAANHSEDIANPLTPRWPVKFTPENAIIVGASTSTDIAASYSNFGWGKVHLFAPGGTFGNAVYSTAANSDTSYGGYYGTSFAAPHVAGAVALMRAQFPYGQFLETINRITRAVDVVVDGSGNQVYYSMGRGRLNLDKALTQTRTSAANDEFAFAYKITALAKEFGGNNINATAETGEPSHASIAPQKTTWWEWNSTVTGTVTIQTAGTRFPHVLAVYTGTSVSSLSAVTSTAVANPCTLGRVTFTASSGTIYRIAIGSYDGSEGVIRLTVHSGNQFAQGNLYFDPATLSRGSGTFSFTLRGPALINGVTPTVYVDHSTDWINWNNVTSGSVDGSGNFSHTHTGITWPFGIYRARYQFFVQGESCNMVGFADVTISSGSNYKYKANPFFANDNRISALIPNPPDGAQINLHNDTTWSYDDLFDSGAWDNGGTAELLPGYGFAIKAPSQFTINFFGEVPQDYFKVPLPQNFGLRSHSYPLAGNVSRLGFVFGESDSLIFNKNNTQEDYHFNNGIWRKLSSGTYIKEEPTVGVGDAFFIVRESDWKAYVNSRQTYY